MTHLSETRMLARLPLATALLVGASYSLAQSPPCVVATYNIVSSLDSYSEEVAQKKPFPQIAKCLRTNSICLLLRGGKVVVAETWEEVPTSSQNVIFAADQTRRTVNRRYCTTATLVPEIGGTYFWAYRTFLPNGGWIGENLDGELIDPSDKPKTPKQVSRWTSRAFEVFLKHLAETLASPNFVDGDGGLRRGDRP